MLQNVSYQEPMLNQWYINDFSKSSLPANLLLLEFYPFDRFYLDF